MLTEGFDMSSRDQGEEISDPFEARVYKKVKNLPDLHVYILFFPCLEFTTLFDGRSPLWTLIYGITSVMEDISSSINRYLKPAIFPLSLRSESGLIITGYSRSWFIKSTPLPSTTGSSS